MTKACNPKTTETRDRRNAEAHWPAFVASLVSSKPVKNLLRVDEFLKITLEIVLWPPHICAHMYMYLHTWACMCAFF